MNQAALEKFIVKEFLGETNYAQTDGTKWWFVVYGLAEASEWQASVDNHPAFRVTDTRSVPDEGFVIEFCFTQPPRITYGDGDAEIARLRAAE